MYFVGWETGFQYYFLVLVPFIFYWPLWEIIPKVFVSMLLYLIYSGVFILSRTYPPVYVLDYWKSNSITLFIVFTTFTVYGLMSRYYQVSVKEYEEDLQNANTLLKDLAGTDSLTNLKNRRKMNQELSEEENRIKLNGKLFSLVMGDIDNFKMINDVYGHDFGDHVLITTSNLIRLALRSEDVIARWGGEEFLILLPETDCLEAKEVIERLRIEISSAPIRVDNIEIFITMTFGIAEYSEGSQMSNLINLADKAMYQGKMSGKNQVVLQSPINRDLSKALN